MEYLISSVIGYLLGSIPTGYILLKKIKGIDITQNGSGNVGAYNSFRITKSKRIGLLVLLIDFTKGALSALILIWIYPANFIFPALAIHFAVLSHCFNPWINFSGGRGLATAAGGAAVVFPYLVAVWSLLWVIFYLMRKNIIFSNIGATVFSLLLVYSTAEIAVKYAAPKPADTSSLILVTASVLTIIFIKHIVPLQEFINDLKTKRVVRK